MRLTLHARDAVALAVERVGSPIGQPLLFVPGTFSNSSFWLGTRGVGLARAAAEQGFDCWVLDPRGHGASQPHRGQPWSFEDWIGLDLPRVQQEIGRPAWWVGHSAGGAAMLASLAAYPELRGQVKGLAMLASPSPWCHPRRLVLAFVAMTTARSLGAFPARRWGLGPDDEVGPVMAQWMEWNLRGRWQGIYDYLALAGELRLPVLALAGAGDRSWAPPRDCEALARVVPGARFEVCGRGTGYSTDFGHASLVASRAACLEVWPRLRGWFES